MKKNILITGASSGIGREIAIHFVKSNIWNVIATVRNELDGESLIMKTKGLATVVYMDIAKQRDINIASEQVNEIVGSHGLYALINNAGIVVSGPLECLHIEAIRNQFDVNLFGAIAMTQAMLPLIRQAHGKIINIGSISGRVTLPLMGPYSASKAAFERISMAFRSELYPWGIPVTLIEPGNFKTPIWKKSIASTKNCMANFTIECQNRYINYLLKAEKLSNKMEKRSGDVSKLVKVIEKVLSDQKPKAKYVIGCDAYFLGLLVRFSSQEFLDFFGRCLLGFNKIK
ncbi:MAG: SDR family oxidoreductase [Magnetococcus sp. DMHC-1]